MRYIFEDYAFDTDRRELHRGSEVVSIAPQVFDLLDYLIRNREHVVSKDDLINAVWNGRIVSDTALTTRLNAARSAIGDSGDEQRLIKTLPRKGFRFVGAVHEAQRPASTTTTDNQVDAPKPTLTLPDKPSIAVLPFTNLSSDLEQEYFADGMVEEIITALSRFQSLFVIARNSSFTYKGRAVDVKRVGQELGVRYVLEGSIRRSGTRMRIATQLIDASTGAHLWADRFDGAAEDIFDLQDQLTIRVVGAIAPKLEQAEIDRARRKPPESLDSYDYYLRGVACWNQMTPDSSAEAAKLFYKAIDLDPNFASAYARVGLWYHRRKDVYLELLTEQDWKEALRLAQRAVELAKDDAVVLNLAAHVFLGFGDYERAGALADRSVALNSNIAPAWATRGWTILGTGRPERAIEAFTQAMRLNPLEPITYSLGFAASYLALRQYEESYAWATKFLLERPTHFNGLLALAISAAFVGREQQSKQALTRLREAHPKFRASDVRRFPTSLETLPWLIQSLKDLGVPE